MGFRWLSLSNGKKAHVDEDGAALYSLRCGRAVQTSKGSGTIAGGDDTHVFVVLTADILQGTATAFPIEEIGSEVVLEDAPPISPSHPLKTIVFRGSTVRIVTQSKQGPCPIFAVANALALQGKLELIPDDGCENILESTLNRMLCEYFCSTVRDGKMVEAVTNSDKMLSEAVTDHFTQSKPLLDKATGTSHSTVGTSVEEPLFTVQREDTFFKFANSCTVEPHRASSSGTETPKFSRTEPDCLNGAISSTSSVALPSAGPESGSKSEDTLVPNFTPSVLSCAEKVEGNSLDAADDRNTFFGKGSRSSCPFRKPMTYKKSLATHRPSEVSPPRLGLQKKSLYEFSLSVEFDTLRHKIAKADSSCPHSIDALLSDLYSGMDLDLVFSGVEDFIIDDKVVFFPLFGLRVVHGWVIGEDMKAFERLRNFSYNDLTTAIVSTPNESNTASEIRVTTDERNSSHQAAPIVQRHDQELVKTNEPSSILAAECEEGGEAERSNDSSSCTVGAMIPIKELAGAFFDRTAGIQMTKDGYKELLERFPENEVGVLFWQNHFYTLTRMQDRLLVLLTPEWYRKISSYTFEVVSLSSPHSDYCDGTGTVIDKLAVYMASEGGCTGKSAVFSEEFPEKCLSSDMRQESMGFTQERKAQESATSTVNAGSSLSFPKNVAYPKGIIRGKVVGAVTEPKNHKLKDRLVNHEKKSVEIQQEMTVAQVSSVFPQMDLDLIKSLLQQHKYNVQNTIDAILKQ